MAKHWSLALSFRERRPVVKNQDGAPQVVIDKKLLEMIGAQSEDEVLCKIASDGSLVIRKLG